MIESWFVDQLLQISDKVYSCEAVVFPSEVLDQLTQQALQQAVRNDSIHVVRDNLLGVVRTQNRSADAWVQYKV